LRSQLTDSLILGDGANSYVYGPDGLPIEQINTSTGTVTYLHHDQAGSTRLLTGSTGTVTGKCTYTAYGTPTCEGTTTTPLGYDAQYTSSDTGHIYLRAREYDPATAQFLTVDPIANLTRAPYNYANDNPINYTDRTGLCSIVPGSSENCFSEVSGAIISGVESVAEHPVEAGGVVLGGVAVASGVGEVVAGGTVVTEGTLGAISAISGTAAADDVTDITFGHGARHLAETTLDSGEVESAIQSQIEQSTTRASATGSFWGRTVVDGQTIEYRAYMLPNGTINVGTYYVVP
jgi:RHS repeat-associated protein